MRTPIIAGNWKMHKTIFQAVEHIRQMQPDLGRIGGVDKVVCPPFVALAAVKEVVQATDIGLGAQNMHWEEQGAFTGEISPLMLQDLCQYVIVGHSERRAYFGETDEGVNRKVKAALDHNLTPIICVGENLEQHEAGQTEEWVSGQVRAAFEGLAAAQARQTILAYEPIWAIGTGHAATPAGANAVIGLTIRGTLTDLYDEDTAQAIRVQYGGSVKASNIEGFMTQPDIDGALVGGASLKSDEFLEIVRIAAGVKGHR